MTKLEQYGLKPIDNTHYKTMMKSLYKESKDLREQIDTLKAKLEANYKVIEQSENRYLDLGIERPEYNSNDLKIGDTIIFYSLAGGYYGIFKGRFVYNAGYAEVEDIEMIDHPTGCEYCSHRVGFNEIIKIVQE